MYESGHYNNNKTNRQLTEEMIRLLRRRHGEKHGLKDKAKSPLLKDTLMLERKTCITYNAGSLDESAVLFTGQCLLKKGDDLECPVTFQDAVECARLNELLKVHTIPTICMYPDSTYAKFIRGWSGANVSENDINTTTKAYIEFRGRILPNIKHVRVSDFQEEIDKVVKKHIPDEERDILRKKIRRIYGGRLLKDGREHPLQEVLLEYGIKTILLPSIIGYENRDIGVFAEPAEICSTYAAEMVSRALDMNIQIGLIGQLPVPSLEFLIDRELDMYSARRESRIHLNETDSQIRAKLEAEPDFCLVSLYLSPLTTEEQLQEIGKSRDRRAGTDIMVDQIREFRRYL